MVIITAQDCTLIFGATVGGNKMNIQSKDTSRGHFYVSLIKSATRIAAGIALIWPQNIILAGIFLIAAEVLGIVEELV